MKDVLIYTTHKSASSFIYKLCSDLCKFLNIDYYSVNGSQKEMIRQHSWNHFIENDLFTGCFAPIRAGEAMPSIPKNLQEYSVVIHLRDPRDVLTSLFYSHTYSHQKSLGVFNPDDDVRKKWEEEGVDQYVLNHMGRYKERYLDLMNIADNASNPIFLEYAELIGDFPSWLQKLMEAFKHFPLPEYFRKHSENKDLVYPLIHQALVDLYKNEFRIPEKENIYLHKRQLRTGDYLRKLAPETIQILNQEYGDVLRRFNYEINNGVTEHSMSPASEI